MIDSRQSFLLAVNGHVLVCAEPFMRGLSACIFDIHQPDVVALKARMTRDGRSDADIEALPSKYFRDRYLPYTDTLHMHQCHVLFLEHVAHAAVSCFFPRKYCRYSSVKSHAKGSVLICQNMALVMAITD